MTTIKINAITVQDGGEEMVRRFAARAALVENREGFEGFELLAPNDGRNVYLVITRWRDESCFQEWIGSDDFAQAHRAARPDSGPARPDGDQARPDAEAANGRPAGGEAGQRRPALSAELWSFDVATRGSAAP